MGYTHALGAASRLQPVLLPPGIGLATRQCADCPWIQALWVRRRVCAGGARHSRGGELLCRIPTARVVRWLAAPARDISCAVPRSKHSPGMGGREYLPVAPGDPWVAR